MLGRRTEYQPKYITKTVKHGEENIIVWACFSWQGVGPVYWIKENTTSDYDYVEILQNTMLPYASDETQLVWTFQ